MFNRALIYQEKSKKFYMNSFEKNNKQSLASSQNTNLVDESKLTSYVSSDNIVLNNSSSENIIQSQVINNYFGDNLNKRYMKPANLSTTRSSNQEYQNSLQSILKQRRSFRETDRNIQKPIIVSSVQQSVIKEEVPEKKNSISVGMQIVKNIHSEYLLII